MIVIKSTQITMKSVGLLFTSSEKVAYKIYRWISFAILCVLFEPSVHCEKNCLCEKIISDEKKIIKIS